VTRLGSPQVSLEALASFWEHNKTYMMLNMINAAILWSICLIRNDMCFKRFPWLGLQLQTAYSLAHREQKKKI
jgi:hypothetical protein